MQIIGKCEKVESVEKGIKLTIYITDEAQMDEAFRLRKKDVSLSLGHGEMVEDTVNKEAVRAMAGEALRQALAFLYEPKRGTPLADMNKPGQIEWGIMGASALTISGGLDAEEQLPLVAV